MECREIHLRIRDVGFQVIKEWNASSAVCAFSSEEIISCEIEEEWTGREDLFMETEVALGDGTVLYDTETLIPYKHMELPKPKITAEVHEREDFFEIIVQSDVFAPFVEMDFEDADVIFSDNFFTISNERPVVVRVGKNDIIHGSFADAEDLKKRMVFTTIADTY